MSAPCRFTVDRFRGVDGGPVTVQTVDGFLRPAVGTTADGPRLSGRLVGARRLSAFFDTGD